MADVNIHKTVQSCAQEDVVELYGQPLLRVDRLGHLRNLLIDFQATLACCANPVGLKIE